MAASAWKTAGIFVAGLLLATGPYANAVLHSPAFGQLADQPIHLVLSEDFARALAEGQLPPSWAASLSGGRGGPAFVLYPPLFFALVWVCSLVTPAFDSALGLALVAAAGWLFSATYYLARAELSPRRSVLAATLVPLLPGVTLLGWGRGRLPNFFALGWIALVFGALLRIAAGPLRRRDMITLGAGAAGLVLTHALSSVMAGVLILVCLPVLARKLGVRKMAACAGVALAAAAVTAWFWLPMLRAAAFANTPYLEELHPYERSLWLHPPPPEDALLDSWDGVNDFALIIAGVQLCLAAAAGFASRRVDSTLFARTLPWVAGFVVLATVHPIGAWIAEVPGLSFMQFSWRWQAPFAIWCALAVGALPRKRIVAPAFLIAATALFFLRLIAPSDIQAADARTISSSPLSPDEYGRLEPTQRALYVTNLVEMRPRGSAATRFPPAAAGRLEVLSGNASVKPVLVGQARREYRIDAADRTVLRMYTYAFPGWVAEWRGSPVTIEAEPETGLQRLELLAGQGLLRLEFRRSALLWD